MTFVEDDVGEVNLSQAEADALMQMEKYSVSQDRWWYPDSGESVHIPLVSPDRKERFLLDVHRGRIDLSKATYNNRAHQVVVLVRLDLGSGVSHRNPDSQR